MMWQEEFELFLQYRHDYKAEKNMGGKKKKSVLEINVKTSGTHLHFWRLTQHGWFLSSVEHTVLLTYFSLFLNEIVKPWRPVLLLSPPEFPPMWGQAACAAKPLHRVFASIWTSGVTTWPCLLSLLHPVSSQCFHEPTRTNLLRLQNHCSVLQNQVPEVKIVIKIAQCSLCLFKTPLGPEGDLCHGRLARPLPADSASLYGTSVLCQYWK